MIINKHQPNLYSGDTSIERTLTSNQRVSPEIKGSTVFWNFRWKMI